MNRIGSARVLFVALGLVGVLAGCSAAASGAEGSGQPQQAVATVIVDNDSPLTVNVYAIRQSSRFRLGTVSGLTRQEFQLKSHMLDTGSYLQILIDPLGSENSYYTDRIYVDEGDQVRLRVSNFIR